MHGIASICHMNAAVGLDVVMLGRRIAERREALDLDQDDVSERSGMSRAYISRLERGLVPNPKMGDLANVADALGKSLADVLHQETSGRTPDLRRQIAAILGPDKAADVERIVFRLADMAEPDQELILGLIRLQVDGFPGRRPES